MRRPQLPHTKPKYPAHLGLDPKPYRHHLRYATSVSDSRYAHLGGVEPLQQTGSSIRTGFWSSQTLLQHLSAIVDPPDPNKVKESCYRLSMGYEVYVTENLSSVGRHRHSVQELKSNQCFAIDPGHFALMMTLESIRMPTDALGFLSIQTDVKFKGLVNISGFHVDPGSDGKITFAVFNAGPSPVHLRQGDSIFRLWIADLDATDHHPNDRPLPPNIATTAVNSISSPLESLQGLAKKVEKLDNKINQFRLVALAVGSLLAIALLLANYAYMLGKDAWLTTAPSVSSAPIQQTTPPKSTNGPSANAPHSFNTAVLPVKSNETTASTGTKTSTLSKPATRQTPGKNPTQP